jgi:hypothetical protein
VTIIYREQSIMSGTPAALRPKTNCGSPGHYQPGISPVPRKCTVSSAPAILNASWKSCSVRVFSTASVSASITSVVSKWWLFSFILNRGNRKVEWVGNDSHVSYGQKFSCEKGSLRR